MMKYLVSFVVLLAAVQTIIAFPENQVPINTYKGVSTHVYTGATTDNPKQRLYVQILKTLQVGKTKRIALAGRENLYLLDPGMLQNSQVDKSVNFSEVFSWESKQDTIELCRMKGQPEELCYNYLSVVEMASDEEMLICGTNAFAPMCRKYRISTDNGQISLEFEGDEMSGRQRSPYGPNMPTTSLFSGGSLYAATYQSFFGGLSVVSRTMGQAPALRTSTNNVMNEPDFVKMVEDGEKILIFFNEIEVLSTGEKRTIPQVAQVCKNDDGGDRILQGMFTTFLKSRLNCSYNGYYLDQVSDLTNPIRINNELVIFATFSTPDNSLAGSAVCSFTLPSIKTAMLGPFFTNNKKTSSVAIVPPPSSRHPGLCPTEKLSDEELLYVKSYPQMEKQVAGSMLLTNQGNRWTAISADHTSSPSNVVVIIIGTENGHLIKALPPSQNWPHGIIISDSDVFDQERCSSAQKEMRDRRIIKIVVENDTIFVAFKHCVVTVPLKMCSNHRCQSVCNGAADPYCGWNGTACTPLKNPRKVLKEDLNTQACLLRTDVEKENPIRTNDEKSETQPNNDWRNKSLAISTNPPSPAEVKYNAQLVSYETLVIVAIVASVATFIVTVFFTILCCCCRKRKKSDGSETLKEKQTAEIHNLVNDGEKRYSLSRVTQRCREFMNKATTPISSPETKLKSDGKRRRSENVYTEQPSLKQNQIERGRNIRESNSRFDSTSSCSSRKENSGRSINNPAAKPLLSSPMNVCHAETDATLPKSVANAATLRLSPNRVNDASSPTRTSETSFVAPDVYTKMPETSTASSNSAKLRRSENATKQTNEIMRESGSAIRDFEATLKQMQNEGILQPQDDALRQRTASDDSGNGESPRNSYQQTGQGAVEAAKNSRSQRPMSLNVQKSSPNRRIRLLSEGSHPHSEQPPVVFVAPRSNRERHSSGQNSQPTTPMNGQPMLAVCQGNRFFPDDLAVYGNGLRNESGQHHQLYNQQNHHEKMVAFQALQNAPPVMYPSQAQYTQRPPKLQRQMSEPQGRLSVGRSYSTSMKGPPNYYPSLQEKVPHSQMPAFHSIEHAPRQDHAGPKNHYPSLPHRSSKSPYGDNNSYVTGPGFERPATLHKREKLPSLIRQASTPSSTRTGLFVPPPTVPRSEPV